MTRRKHRMKKLKIERVYDDRNRCVGWLCQHCKTKAAYLLDLDHLEGCTAEADGIKITTSNH